MENKNRISGETRVALHNIRSAYNVGSIFRTADAFGIKHIYISGYTPAPKDKFGKIRKEISKTALGGEFYVSWSKNSASNIIRKLREEGFKIVAVEQDKRSVDYRKMKKSKKTLFILGNEVKGLSEEILGMADTIIEIPMAGFKESLNVSVVFGIVASNL